MSGCTVTEFRLPLHEILWKQDYNVNPGSLIDRENLPLSARENGTELRLVFRKLEIIVMGGYPSLWKNATTVNPMCAVAEIVKFE